MMLYMDIVANKQKLVTKRKEGREEEMEEGTSHQKTRRILILKEPSSEN